MEPQAKLDPLTEIALRSLKDIAVPPPVSWMPQTWGWGILALAVAAAILVWCALGYRRWRRNAYRREALKLLDEVAAAMRNPDTREQGINDLSELVKRTALAAWPRKDVAPTSGADWVAVITAHGGDDESPTFNNFFNDLEYQRGKPPTSDVVDELVHGARRWIEGHHVSA
jgi:hypothetical protein